MSVKNAMDKTAAALEKGYTKTSKFISFIKTLSIKSDAHFNCQINSVRKQTPVWRFNFGYNKEFKVSSIILTVLALSALCMLCSCSSKEK